MKRLLIVDDDAVFRERLTKAMTRRGLEVMGASGPEEGWRLAQSQAFEGVLVDLRMPGGSGLDLITRVAGLDPSPHIVVLTGYGSIATALEATKRGADHFLQKPADADEILAALRGEQLQQPPSATPSLERVEWEHLNRVLADCSGNVSEAARRLGLHRRSLQRKLERLAPKD